MKFIKDYQKFKQFRIDEALESGQFLVYHRTRLKEESYVVAKWDKDINLYDNFAKRTIPSDLKEDSEDYIRMYNSNIELLKAMNPNIKLDDKGSPIVSEGDTIITSDPRIMSQGFRPGAGDWYGVGLYTCYDFDDQIRDFDNNGVPDMAMYGPNIVEFKVNNSRKFLILDMNADNNQAKKVWGQSHTLIDQLKKIMGGRFLNFYGKNKELIDSFNEILVKTKVTTKAGREEELKKDEQGRFLTAPIGLKLAEMPGFISLVDGMSFTGGNDGRVLVIYNANLAKPTRYTPDDGKTWSSMEKLDFQYDRVKVGNKDILQCKIIDTDKELNQISLERPNSSKWIVSLDIPTILKDKTKSIKMFSEIVLSKSQFKDNLNRLVNELSKSPKQVIDNIITRANQLPTDYDQLVDIEKAKVGNYYSSLLYFLVELSKKSNYEGDLVKKKSDEILQACTKVADKLNFPLDVMFSLSQTTSDVDRYKNLFTILIDKSQTLYSGELADRDEFDRMLDTIIGVKDSDKYPDWFKDAISGKINQSIQKNFELINMDKPNVNVGNLNVAGRFNHLISKQVLASNVRNLDKFCQVLKADMKSEDFLKILKNKLSMFYDNNKEVSLINVSSYSYPTSWGGKENWLIPKVIKLSNELDEESIESLADFSIYFLTRAKLERYTDLAGQQFLAAALDGTPVLDKIKQKFSKLKRDGEFTLFGIEDSELKNHYKDFYDDLTRFIKLDGDTLPELDYKYIANSIFKAMYGPGTKTQDLLYEFKKLRNIKDLQKVNTEFGERKGMIGGKHDLNWWIKDELKSKDLEELNNILKEKGIDYKF